MSKLCKGTNIYLLGEKNAIKIESVESIEIKPSDNIDKGLFLFEAYINFDPSKPSHMVIDRKNLLKASIAIGFSGSTDSPRLKHGGWVFSEKRSWFLISGIMHHSLKFEPNKLVQSKIQIFTSELDWRPEKTIKSDEIEQTFSEFIDSLERQGPLPS